MQWSDTFAAGFTTGHTWLPVADPATLPKVNVAVQQGDPSSLLSLYRRVIALQAADLRLTRGDYRSVAAHDQVSAFTRSIDSGRLLIAVTFSVSRTPANLGSARAGRLVLSTGSRATGVPVVLGDLVPEPGEAVILDLE